jgi:CDP-glucose 4,6-dehydratase
MSDRTDLSHFAGKRVLVTGHTGFKGAWLALWLKRLGAEVTGLALPPEDQKDNLSVILDLDREIHSVHGDLRDAGWTAEAVHRARPQIVFHLAAESLVRRSYRNPVPAYATNVMGTIHLYEALRGVEGLEAVLTVTTDKVYADRGWDWPYRETDSLGGRDPYSSSKACVEILSSSYRESFLAGRGVAVATARAGNVIGGGDFGEDRIIPDFFRALRSERPLALRSPRSVRPWQHVLDALSGYLVLTVRMIRNRDLCGAWNFGPRESSFVTVEKLVKQLIAEFGGGRFEIALGEAHLKETTVLKLDSSRARTLLGWRDVLELGDAVRETARWYQAYLETPSSAAQLARASVERFSEEVNALIREERS